jgi:proteasome alpha subunit
MNGTDRESYDRGSTIFSPDGRLYQVEYAREAVGRGSPSVAVRTPEGIALVAGTHRRSPLLDADSVSKIHRVDDRITVATAGNAADSRRLVEIARDEAVEERATYGEAPAVEPLARTVADHMQAATQRGGTRPFGTALLFAGVDETGTHLIEADPSGAIYSWEATAIGADREPIQSVLSTQPEPSSLSEAVDNALAALATGHDTTPGIRHQRAADSGADDSGADGESQRSGLDEDAVTVMTVDEEDLHHHSGADVRNRIAELDMN